MGLPDLAFVADLLIARGGRYVETEEHPNVF